MMIVSCRRDLLLSSPHNNAHFEASESVIEAVSKALAWSAPSSIAFVTIDLSKR